ncbi:MAG TPA: MBL fold metallo-hydrolase [Nitrososphaeraceae archaeon]|nr:MBL fold metallo-hydrolase [Nitrososphaeraceae archaeon]
MNKHSKVNLKGFNKHKNIVFISYFTIGLLSLFLYFSTIIVNDVDAQDENVTINITKLTDAVFMLKGSGGNIVVSVGQDGVILVDDQFAPLTEKIKEAISKITDDPVKYVFNTHWHSDHVGGNENLGEAGAIIVSHDNVRKRLSTEQFIDFLNKTVSPLPEKGLPIVTFSDNMTLFQNDDEIKIIHVDNGHTDGDSIVYFTKNNVIHVGDDFNDKSYPFIDISSGGSIDGLISSLETVSSIINDETKVISGHSEISNKTKINDFTDMLKDVREKVNQMINDGKSLEEIIASQPTSKYDEIYYDHSSRKPGEFVTFIYHSLT